MFRSAKPATHAPRWLQGIISHLPWQPWSGLRRLVGPISFHRLLTEELTTCSDYDNDIGSLLAACLSILFSLLVVDSILLTQK